MQDQVNNLTEKLWQIKEHWSPRVIAELNDYQFKLVKLQGEFVWHSHPDTDEAFFVLSGEMKILFRDREISLSEGDLFIVPKGQEHKPLADSECHVMLVEPRGVVNTGSIESNFTAPNDVWI